MSRVDDIINAARSQLGVPFSLGRRYDGKALDCVGLLQVVAHRCGIPLQVPAGYSKRALIQFDAHQTALDAGCSEKLGPAQPGDIVRLEVRPKFPLHFGIVTGKFFIHACDLRNCVVEDLFFQCADVRVRGIYSWPK